ncbi:MAG: DNA/RNA nuclease SfsA [Marivibrio sp.]|uniref:DNA/RNA nuclease SfsA n=1 Tax=Marivibrio sp. TaxID=2039719 RepID=UPI0032EAA69B
MRYPAPLVEGRLLRRYKRFLADVALGADGAGESVVAHCGNPGSMIGLADPGSAVWLARNANPKAKLDWRWEIATQTIDGAAHPVGINTGLANRIVEGAIAAGRIAPLAGYESLRREVKYGANSRIDLLLESRTAPPCYVEVKSVTLRRPEGPDPAAAEFPDAVTARGAKHLAELAARAQAGERAVMVYLVQRADCAHFRLADDIDPAYAHAFAQATGAGVEVLCYDCLVAPEGIELNGPLATAL